MAAPAPASGDLKAFSLLTNSIPAYVTVGGASAWALVDTGNPWVLLDPTTFPAAASLPTSGGTLSSIALASETASNAYVFGSNSGDVQADATFRLAGNIGCSVVCDFAPAFNYRDVTLTLGNTTPPDGLGTPVTVPFSFEGGGTEDGVEVPRSRIVVTVSVEGTDYPMIVDTGATDVTLSQAAFTSLTSDGRAQISGGTAETTSGVSTSSITRAASVAVGGAVVESLIVAHDSSFDTNLAAVSTDVGETVDGSLGGSFLHDFYVVIDYAAQTITLTPYTDLGFILDAGEHIGITLGASAGTYVVADASADATAAGVQVGDEVVSIDGQVLTEVTSLEAETLLYGKVGSTKEVTFAAAQQLAGMTIPLMVEETLPLP